MIVDWICEICERFKISQLASHQAVAILDQYFSVQPDIPKSETTKQLLYLLGYTSIYISAKFVEKDAKGPTASDISTHSQRNFSKEKIIKTET
jgi:hypothetical protein